MIPLRIELHNFRAITYANIDLTDVTIAAIAGKNGAGKSSAFTLAPRFALFGDVIKGVSMDNLVRKGATDMSVIFEFEHQGSVFRTIRTRSTKGSGKSTFEFQHQVNSKWESRSAEKIIDTEAKIRELLNLDDETFTASSMILQGRANEFTAATPGRRKEILQQILGLNIYDQLQERARAKSGVLNIEIEKIKDKLATLDVRLMDKPLKQEELQQLAEQSYQNDLLIISNGSDIQKLEEQIRSLQTKSEKVAELGLQINVIEDDIEKLHFEQTGHAGKVIRASKVLENEAAIQAKSIEYDETTKQIAVLESKFPEQGRLQNELVNLRYDLNAVTTSLQPLAARIDPLKTLLNNQDMLKQKAAEYSTLSTQLDAHQKLADQWDQLERELSDARVSHTEEDQRIELLTIALNNDIKNLTAKTAMLEDANCIDVTKAACRFLADAQDAKGSLLAKQTELADIDRSLFNQLLDERTRITNEQKAIGYDHTAHVDCKVQADQLKPLADQYAQLAGKDELLQSLIDQQSTLEQQKLLIDTKILDNRNAQNDLQELLALLPGLKVKLTQLQDWVKLKDELAAAKESKQNAEERITAIDADIRSKTTRKSELDLQRSAILLETLEFDNLQGQLTAGQNLLRVQRELQTHMAGEIGGLKAIITALEADEQELARLSKEMEPKVRRWTRYQTLVKAFGRDGIPALIIENAVPALERIANEILGQMSKGKHYVRFETQRDLKNNKGVAETLDIMIGDWTSERPYETFSGGEQLRIDYAIRFALAELLAQRAGSKVEWLTIDEGLGSQDAEHRALVLDSIKSVASRFKKVLVITHLEDAQQAFEQVIYFDNHDGSVDVQVA
jgi:exonuclease SbcC